MTFAIGLLSFVLFVVLIAFLEQVVKVTKLETEVRILRERYEPVDTLGK